MRNIPVSGAWSIPAITPPIPTRAKFVMFRCPNPNVFINVAKNIPENAPINRAGANVPPTPPAAKVNDVATAFNNIINNIITKIIQILSWKHSKILFSNRIDWSLLSAAFMAS